MGMFGFVQGKVLLEGLVLLCLKFKFQTKGEFGFLKSDIKMKDVSFALFKI